MASMHGTGSRGLDIHKIQSTLMSNGAIILDRADEVLSIGDRLEHKPVSAVR
jgi:hypothetical protein